MLRVFRSGVCLQGSFRHSKFFGSVATSTLGGLEPRPPFLGSNVPPPLPHYPPEVARSRKRLINSAVAKCPVGRTPSIPDGYLAEENQMWEALYQRVMTSAGRHACREYLEAVRTAALSTTRIPDIEDFSGRLFQHSGWQVAPVTGAISPETFLEHLRCREMPCTQYIRPHTKFSFTEDPDCIHEMLGHLPALFIPAWARLSQAFGATARRLRDEGKEELLDKLTLVYFAVLEKGLVKQDGEIKAIGASVISGSGELVHAMERTDKHLPFEMDLILKYGSTDETDFMPYFFVGESVESMADIVTGWLDSL